MCIKIKKKKTTHGEIGERTYINIYIYIYMKIKYKYNVCQNDHKTNIQDVIYLK